MRDVSVDCRSTPLNVNKQIFKKFPTYVKNIVQIHKWQMTTPDYLMIDLKSKGGAATPTRGDGRLIVYGIKGTHNDVSSSVLDAAYVVENEKMVMETDLDMNGKRLLNYNPKSKTVIFGNYDSNRRATIIPPKRPFELNDAHHNFFGFDFTIKKITLTITSRTMGSNPANARLQLRASGKELNASGVYSGSTVSYSLDFAVGANELLELDLTKGSGIIKANAVILIEI